MTHGQERMPQRVRMGIQVCAMGPGHPEGHGAHVAAAALLKRLVR